MKPYPYIILGALATGLWLCPSCDSRSDRSVMDQYDRKPAAPLAPTGAINQTTPQSAFTNETARPEDRRVSDRPWVPHREPVEADPMKAGFRESADRRADELDERLRADREELDRQRDTTERMQDTSGPFARQLPEFALADPKGMAYTHAGIAAEGVVFVVTAPTIASKSAQEGWSKTLAEARGGARGKIVFIEDMSQSAFKETARGEMRKDYDPATGPLVLIDEVGSVRQQLQVPEDRTVVLVYDATGKLIHSEQGDPTPERARMVWEKLRSK